MTFLQKDRQMDKTEIQKNRVLELHQDPAKQALSSLQKLYR